MTGPARPGQNAGMRATKPGKKTRKRKSVRKHEVRATLTVQELTRAGTSLDLEIYAGGEKLGTLQVGRGSLKWWGRKWVHGKRLSWSRFADHMDSLR